MISVVKVFNTIRDLCNEDQRGFVTPEVFNSFAEVAQTKLYDDMKRALLDTARLRRSNIDLGGVDSSFRDVKEDMAEYLEETVISTSTASNSFDRSVFLKPMDLDKVVSIDTFDDSDAAVANGFPCDIVYEVDKVSSIQRSKLSAPTTQFPVALVHNEIELIPDDVDKIRLMYYRRPSSRNARNSSKVDMMNPPRYIVKERNQATGLFLVDMNNSRDFDLPQQYYPNLVNEIASLMGVRLRDPLISGYAAQQQAQA